MVTKPSKFSSIFEADEDPIVEQTPTSTETPVIAEIPTPEPAPEPVVEVEQESPKPRTTSRTMGKNRDPNYRQVTAYIRKDIDKNVRDALYDESRGQADAKPKEFSELVDELLEEWLKEHAGSKRRKA